jgi:hypothetical protein
VAAAEFFTVQVLIPAAVMPITTQVLVPAGRFFLYIINMYAVNAVYDGTKILAVEPISVEGCYEVVVTFLRKINSKSDMEFCEQLSRNSLKDAWFPGDEDL